MKLPWVEKYRPKELEDLLCNDDTLEKINNFISNGIIDQHLILTGTAGLGKTTTAKILAEKISPDDYLYICASGKGIDEIRNKVSRFCSNFGLNTKIVILDEFDGLSKASMMLLRNVLEEFVETTRFILTCNYISNIIESIQSRCMIFEYSGVHEKTIARKCLQILKKENVEIRNAKHIGKLVRTYYPDIRAIINNLEKNTHNGFFELKTENLSKDSDIIEYIIKKDWNYIRENYASKGDFNALYKLIFDNAHLIDETKSALIRLHVLEAIRHHNNVYDQEINFMGCIDCILQEIEE